MDYKQVNDPQESPYLNVSLSNFSLLNHSLLNKGMAFTHQERIDFDLLGLIPPFESNLAIQRTRSYETFLNKNSDLEKYIYLRDLQNSNETLFYSLLSEHLTDLMPIIYTPTVGLGCQRYSQIYRRPRGIYLSYPNRGLIDKILSYPHFDPVEIIVVSDGERILGLGDQGAGGMGIPIGKLALYTACAGIHPEKTLPILLDTGTNNTDLISDTLYIGWHNERVRGPAYDEFIDLFVQAVKKRFPRALLQWEDFAQLNANPILSRYRNELCTFNDDIQGTAAVAAGTLFSAMQVTGIPLEDQRIVIAGAGSAGCGIGQLLLQAVVEKGIDERDARKNFYLIDQHGLLMEDNTSLLSFQKPFAHSKNSIAHWQYPKNRAPTLEEVVMNVHPTLLIGASAQPHLFTEKLIKEMAAHVERPIIFPLSNPISRCEALPTDLNQWTNERAIIGMGSPFGDIQKKGKPFRVDQTNNCYIFPGMGLGLISVGAKIVTDTMFMQAAIALGKCSPAKDNPEANLLPPLTSIVDVSVKVATAVAEEALEKNLATFHPPGDLETFIRKTLWTPSYLPYKRVNVEKGMV